MPLFCTGQYRSVLFCVCTVPTSFFLLSAKARAAWQFLVLEKARVFYSCTLCSSNSKNQKNFMSWTILASIIAHTITKPRSWSKNKTITSACFRVFLHNTQSTYPNVFSIETRHETEADAKRKQHQPIQERAFTIHCLLFHMPQGVFSLPYVGSLFFLTKKRCYSDKEPNCPALTYPRVRGRPFTWVGGWF